MRVLIESPFGRNVDGSQCTPAQYARNTVYVRRALADSLSRGEAPFASHAIYPLVLDDSDADARRRGMEAGFSWGDKAEAVVVYGDYGKTSGMCEGIARWRKQGTPIEFRLIGKNNAPTSRGFCEHGIKFEGCALCLHAALVVAQGL